MLLICIKQEEQQKRISIFFEAKRYIEVTKSQLGYNPFQMATPNGVEIPNHAMASKSHSAQNLHNQNVVEGEVGDYSNLSSRSKKDGMTPDHIPSFGAIEKAMRDAGYIFEQKTI